jgi:hypothetical protein
VTTRLTRLRPPSRKSRASTRDQSTYSATPPIQITLDRYGHLIPGNEQEAARLLDRYLLASEDLG